MAAILVLQPDRAGTLVRGLERVVGSSVGGLFAWPVLYLADPAATALVAGLLVLASIALRNVNYTAFVMLLTPLFILTMDLIAPAAGIASARIMDNLVGSFAALMVVTALWPERRDLPAMIDQALRANGIYAAVALSGSDEEVAIAQRQAGITSTSAELGIHAVERTIFRRLISPEDLRGIADARFLAGLAAVRSFDRQLNRSSF